MHKGIQRTPRRKTLLACEHCRFKKIKCDGARPVCGACSRKGWGTDKCLYRHIEKKGVGVSESVIHELQSRIQMLEQQANQSALLTAGYSTSSPPQNEEIIHNGSPSYSYSDIERPVRNTTEVDNNAITASDSGQLHNEGSHGGGSSTASSVHNVRRAIEERIPADPTTGMATAAPEAHQPSIRQLSYVLPPRKSADELLECYWQFVYPLDPFIDQHRFTPLYDCLWNGTPLPESPTLIMRLDEESSVATLNLALALACQYQIQNERGEKEAEEETHAAAEIFFNRAHEIVNFDPTDTKNLSVQVVQVMLLMAQYLTGTGKTHKAWGVIGMALRGCHHLGLHRELTYKNIILDPQDREFARRIYDACLMLERMICMNLGRPAMVSTGNSDLIPLPSDTSDVVENGSGLPGLPLHEPDAMKFFVASAKLYQIAQQMLASFYSDEPMDQSQSQDYKPYFEGSASIFRFERDLSKWCDNLPEQLDLRRSRVPNQVHDLRHMTLRRQSIVLRLRYLQARLYLLRPVFARFCASAAKSNPPTDECVRPCGDILDYRVALQCCILCVKTAMELIQLTHESLTESENWRRNTSWLNGVMSIYLSATVVLAARLKPVVTLGAIRDSELQMSWHKAMQILGRFPSDSVSAKRCLAVLWTLQEKLSLPSPLRGDAYLSPGIAEHTQTQGDVDANRTDSGALVSQDILQVFGSLDSFDDFKAEDLSWLNVVPGDYLA